MKYLINNDREIVSFSNHISHKEMVDNLGWVESDVHSAGYICLKGDEVVCFGRATSMNAETKPESTLIAIKAFKEVVQ